MRSMFAVVAAGSFTCFVGPLSMAVTIGPDSFGYVATNDYLSAWTDISGSPTRVTQFDAELDAISPTIPLGFTFRFYGRDYSDVRFTNKGAVIFGTGPVRYENSSLTSSELNHSLISPLWDDWLTNVAGSGAKVFYQTLGNAGSRRFIVQWDRVYGYGTPNTDPVEFNVILYEGSNRIDFNYDDVVGDVDVPFSSNDIGARSRGGSATVGIADAHGNANGSHLQWSHNRPVISEGRTITFLPPTTPLPATAPNPYTFQNIADSASPMFESFGRPSINDAGTVAFLATADAQMGGGQKIFTATGQSVAQIADTLGEFDSFSPELIPAINNEGTVAIAAALDIGGYKVVTIHGGQASDVVTTGSGNTFNTLSNPDINDVGTVAFLATRRDTPASEEITGIYKKSNDQSPIIKIADSSGDLMVFGAPSINDDGVVAFQSERDPGALTTPGKAIYFGDGAATLTPVATTAGQQAPSDIERNQDINDAGAVVFKVDLASGDEAILIGDGSGTTQLANAIGFQGFESFGDAPGINNRGDVAFLATGLDNNSGMGIFTGDDLLADKVVRTGDLLFGSIVTSLEMFHGLNEAGQIAFQYGLADGRTGIAIATPAIPGDYNRDAVVNAADYVLWRNWRGRGGAGLAADGDGNGTVDQADYDLWLANFGRTSVGSSMGASSASVPEPSVVVLLAVAICLVILPRNAHICHGNRFGNFVHGTRVT
jgi:hypothetical protein